MDTKALHAAEQRLRQFLEELIVHMGRANAKHWAGMYIRGLLLDGERKSIEPWRPASRVPMCRPSASSWARARGPGSRSRRPWP